MGVREEITERIIRALETGVPPWRAGWSSGSLAFNAETGQTYQGVNQLLLGMSGHADPRWMTLKQANRKGLRIRKGEKATKIVRLVEVDRETAEKEDHAEGLPHDQQKILVMRQYDVFNGSQIEGLEALPARSHAIEPVLAAEGVVDGLKATGLVVIHGGSTASYSPKMDVIRMPEKADFHSTEDYYATLLHESAHATGSPKRLNRPMLSARFGSSEYAKEELRAEIASAMLSAELGIPLGPKQIESHAAYVASWIEALRNDRNEIFRAAGQAQQIADYLQEMAIVPQPEIEAKQGRLVAPAAMAPKPRNRPSLRSAG